MDMDVECFRSTASFLQGFDVVLNVELADQVTVTNAVMASIPNATLWRHVFKLLQVIAFHYLPFSCGRPSKTIATYPRDILQHCNDSLMTTSHPQHTQKQ